MSEQISIDVSQLERVGDNVRAVQVGSLLILAIDTTKPIGPSASGKMLGFGSTGGFALLPGGFKGNVYVGKKA